MAFVPFSAELERIATQIVDAAYKIHKKLGPGLLESVYEACLVYELERRGLHVDRQVPVDIVYEELRIEGGLRLDLLVRGEVIIEIKAVEKMNEVFAAQLISYLKLTGKRLGFLINFNVPLIKDGIQRIVN